MEDQQPSSFIVESLNHQNLDVHNDSAKPKPPPSVLLRNMNE